jgi:hypothetical protein
MKTFRFYGSSDDLFEIEGAIREEINCCDGRASVQIRSAITEARIRIIGEYIDPGTWSMGVSLVDEGDTLPAWPIRLFQKHPYSVALEIDVPDDATLSQENIDGLSEIT